MLKPIAALKGQSIKEYVLGRALADIPALNGIDQEDAFEALAIFLKPRIDQAHLGQLSSKSNLSFALTMSGKPRVPTSSILATVYEAEEDLTDSAYENARKLLNQGCRVNTGVDATRLSDTIWKRQFRTIIFQSPNLDSRDPRYG